MVRPISEVQIVGPILWLYMYCTHSNMEKEVRITSFSFYVLYIDISVQQCDVRGEENAIPSLTYSSHPDDLFGMTFRLFSIYSWLCVYILT